MLLPKEYRTLTAWKKPPVDDYEQRNAGYIFVKKFKGLIQYPIGQYYSKLLDIYDKETIRMTGILFAPVGVNFEAKNVLRNIDGTLYAFYSLIPANENVSMLSSVGKIKHNEYRIEFINKNIDLKGYEIDENV